MMVVRKTLRCGCVRSDVILCGCLGSKHQLTNLWLCDYFQEMKKRPGSLPVLAVQEELTQASFPSSEQFTEYKTIALSTKRSLDMMNPESACKMNNNQTLPSIQKLKRRALQMPRK